MCGLIQSTNKTKQNWEHAGTKSLICTFGKSLRLEKMILQNPLSINDDRVHLTYIQYFLLFYHVFEALLDTTLTFVSQSLFLSKRLGVSEMLQLQKHVEQKQEAANSLNLIVEWSAFWQNNRRISYWDSSLSFPNKPQSFGFGMNFFSFMHWCFLRKFQISHKIEPVETTINETTIICRCESDFPFSYKANAQILLFSICFFLHKLISTCKGHFTQRAATTCHGSSFSGWYISGEHQNYNICWNHLCFCNCLLQFFTFLQSCYAGIPEITSLCPLITLNDCVLCHCSKTDGM